MAEEHKYCGITLNDQYYQCSFEVVIDLIDGKWKSLILWHLMNGVQRNSDLQRLIPKITQKMLVQKLRELESKGIVSRKVYPVVPPKVEYYLTEQGEKLRPILDALNQWGNDYIAQHENVTVERTSNCNAQDSENKELA